MMVSHDPLCDQLHGDWDEEDVPSLVTDVALIEVHNMESADDGRVDMYRLS